MTSQVGLHSNDMLPYSFRLPRPTPQDHGLTTQYARSLGNPTNPFEMGLGSGSTAGTNFSASARGTFLDTFESFGDPDLCVTPEKPTPKLRRTLREQQQQEEHTDDEEAESESIQTPSRTTKHKVRFDQNIEVKQMSPEYLPEVEEGGARRTSLEALQEQAKDFDYETKEGGVRKQGCTVLKTRDTSPEPKHSDYKVHNYMDYIEIDGTPDLDDAGSADDLEPISVVASDLRETNKTKSRKDAGVFKRKAAKAKKATDSLKSISQDTSPVTGSGSMTEKTESVFARPEFNTTLRLGREMEQLQEEELDLPTAVKQKLDISDKTKAQIQEKASVKLNTEISQFTSLIPVDVKEDSLVHYIEREESAKAKNALITKPKLPEELEGQEPDIMEFFTPDLQRETASFNIEGFLPPQSGPRSTDPMRAFDIYRHVRAWEGW